MRFWRRLKAFYDDLNEVLKEAAKPIHNSSSEFASRDSRRRALAIAATQICSIEDEI